VLSYYYDFRIFPHQIFRFLYTSTPQSFGAQLALVDQLDWGITSGHIHLDQPDLVVLCKVLVVEESLQLGRGVHCNRLQRRLQCVSGMCG
jgi:hypothetical protein